MSLRRETIDRAFFERLQSGLAPLKPQTFERRYIHWSDLPCQPAVLYHGDTETPLNREGAPPRWSLRRTVLLYLRPDTDPTVPAGTVINPWLDALERLCEFDVARDRPVSVGVRPYYTTLGGLVAWAWIAGPLVRYEAIQEEGQLVVDVPIEISVPSQQGA